MFKVSICMLALAAVTASAQQWDVGLVGGFGFANNLTVNNGSGSATTGFKNGAVFGAYGAEDLYRNLSGELNYLYRLSNLKLSGAGQNESFDAHTHIVTFDLVQHFRPKGAHIRPFVSVGGGVKVVVGTGDEAAPQPLGASCYSANPTCFAALTATREVLFVGDVGGGVKIQLRKHLRLRFQVRDYIGSSPSQVIAAGPGANISGVLNDIVATGAVGVTW